jgi:hypothetical protein
MDSNRAGFSFAVQHSDPLGFSDFGNGRVIPDHFAQRKRERTWYPVHAANGLEHSGLHVGPFFKSMGTGIFDGIDTFLRFV